MNPDTLNLIADLFAMVGVPVLLFIGGLVVAELKKHGYRTTYADALVRAAGVAYNAASDKGMTLATPAGRSVGLLAAVAYMQTTVPQAATALGIDEPGTATRVRAQIGVQSMQALPAAVVVSTHDTQPA